MNWKKELAGLLCLLLALVLFCSAATAVLLPKRYDYGAVWGMYQKEPEDSVDVLFFGSSLVYCDVVPAVIYEETGITSFVMAGPEQTFPVTCRYLRESCKTQSPKAVLIEATGLLFGKTNRSLKVNLTYLPWGVERLASIWEDADPQDRMGLLFPPYAYHDRWDKLEPSDWQEGLWGYEPDPMAGYTFLDRAAPMERPTVRDYQEDYSYTLSFAEEMVAYCREQGITPVFYLSPNISQPGPELTARMKADLTALGAEFWDFNEDLNSLGLDLSTDFFDTLHFNYRGAEKFSRLLADRIAGLGVEPSGGEDRALWQERIDAFAERKAEWDGKPVRKAEGASPQAADS